MRAMAVLALLLAVAITAAGCGGSQAAQESRSTPASGARSPQLEGRALIVRLSVLRARGERERHLMWRAGNHGHYAAAAIYTAQLHRTNMALDALDRRIVALTQRVRRRAAMIEASTP